MKAKILLFFAVMLLNLTVIAQTDITPSRYIFSNQPVGTFQVNAAIAGANPVAGWTAPVADFNNGYVALSGGPAVFTSLDAPQVVAIRQGLNIVDLGGQVGKVLVLRGKTSTYPVGTKMGTGYDGAWFHLNFYLDKNNTPIAENIRVRLVFSIYENEINRTTSALDKFYISTWQNAAAPNPQPSLFPSELFQTTDEAGDPVANDEGEAFYDPTKWMVYEFDIKVPEVAGNPARLKMEIKSTAGNMTLFIKEIKFTKSPTGTPITGQIIKLTPTVTSVEKPKADANQLEFGVNANTVKLFNTKSGSKVTVYTSAGQQYKSFITTVDNASFNLNNGLYIVKVEGKIAKISI